MASKTIVSKLTNLTQIQFTQDGKYVWFGDEEIGYRQIFPESGWEGSEFILYAIDYQNGKTKELKKTPWIRLDKLPIKSTVASSVKLVHGDREKIIIQTYSHLIFLDWNGNLIQSIETPCHQIWTLKIALNEQYAAFVDTESRRVWIFNFQTEQWHTFRKKEILHSAAVQWQENICVIATAKAILFFECIENEWHLKKKIPIQANFVSDLTCFSKHYLVRSQSEMDQIIDENGEIFWKSTEYCNKILAFSPDLSHFWEGSRTRANKRSPLESAKENEYSDLKIRDAVKVGEQWVVSGIQFSYLINPKTKKLNF